jgi:diguanylate cyclase (GGDEF)-like protein
MRVHCRLLPSGQPTVPPAGTPLVVRGFACFSRRLERRPRLTLSLGLVLVASVAAVDVLTGPQLNLSVLYLVPISLVAAVASTAVTFPVAAAAVAVWLVSELPAGNEAASPWVYGWNAGARLMSFLLVALLLHALRSSVPDAESAARTDGLTGLCNRRGFEERLTDELSRVARYRHPLSLVCLDIDDFKRVNDAGGHAAGDELLRRVGQELRRGTRRTDTVARIGGDEFAVVLPETTAESARAATGQILERLRDVTAGAEVGATAGVVTVESGHIAVAALMADADRLLYEAKGAEKGTFRHAVVRTVVRSAAASHDRP